MTADMIKTVAEYFSTQPVMKAWVSGSYARGEEREDSDVDILIRPCRTTCSDTQKKTTKNNVR